ncbi:Pdz domain containing protein [Oopsacas minuta]|uniref:Pdz domain containing protein n=1 Tax=Oopsacas minuta TaxID=111878 RepID=A0AAV7JDW2_9METZ|nr:Pdz domain containing protein [Oopsacas minuta]
MIPYLVLKLLQYIHTSGEEDVLEGRKQVQHSIPKDGPLKFSIQGGTDTVHGGRVLISHIQEGGVAHKYGQIHVGDQILKVDGESLLGVTHEQAAMAIKTAMASKSPTLNLLLAQIPEGKDGQSSNVLSQI